MMCQSQEDKLFLDGGREQDISLCFCSFVRERDIQKNVSSMHTYGYGIAKHCNGWID
jgi:hypothetical protein